MIQLHGDLWDQTSYTFTDGTPAAFTPDAICITTNGFVKKNGEAVMGRGCARQACLAHPGLALVLGKSITNKGNHVDVLKEISPETTLVSFPVKPVSERAETGFTNVVQHMRYNNFNIRAIVPGWAVKAKLSLIRRSCLELSTLADELGWSHVVLPRPGCGAGELTWTSVAALVQPVLDDRFYIITYANDNSNDIPF